jgi:galactokinase
MRAHAPGRVNLIGDHTDYTGGLVLPVAIDLGTTVTFAPLAGEVRLQSSALGDSARVPLDVADPAAVEPPWARYVAGVVRVLRPSTGLEGTVDTTLPVGGGLSSSAALEVAVAVALGFEGTPLELAQACRAAEHLAVGVPSGLMDQLASVAGVEGHALLVDCTTFDVTPIPLPTSCGIWVVDSGQPRELAQSEYAVRHGQCAAAARLIGPLREAGVGDLTRIDDALLRRRARHVITENARVADAAAALAAGDLGAAGAAMTASHASLRDDFDVSTPTLDDQVARLLATPGVHGARLTGAGFGGSVVALTDADAVLPVGRRVRASAGCRLTAAAG